MDYSKAVFAVEIHKLAIQRVKDQMPDNLTEDEKIAYHFDNFAGAVETILNEVDWTMRIIDKQGA